MVKIGWKPEGELQVLGHAGGGKKGEDLVCAAVSALVLTLAANTDRMARAGWVTDPVIRLADGSARICCTPTKEYRAAAELIFGSICAGFEVLAGKYPEHVQVEESALPVI